MDISQSTEQRAVSISPPMKDIFRVYITHRLKGYTEKKTYRSLKKFMRTENSIRTDQKKTCLRMVKQARKKIAIQPTNLIYDLTKGNATLQHLLSKTFQNGEVTWQKLFLILDAIAYAISTNKRFVAMVDVFCDYCEIIHVSSEGHTISEWIYKTGIVKRKASNIVNSGCELLEPVTQNVPTADTVEKNWIKKCSCGSDVKFGYLFFPYCEDCKSFPCPIDRCEAVYRAHKSARTHIACVHSKEEQEKYNAKRDQYKLLYCRCGAVKPSRGKIKYFQCSQCSYYMCMRGNCGEVFSILGNLTAHQKNSCKFPPSLNRCGFCGGKKIKRLDIVTRCPNKNCGAHWCYGCNYEATAYGSVIQHIKHTRHHR